MKILKLKRMKTLIGRIQPFLPKIKKTNLSERGENDTKFLEGNSSNENDAQNSSKRRDDITVPEISQYDARDESPRPRGGNTISGLTLIQTTKKILRIELFPKTGVLFSLYFLFVFFGARLTFSEESTRHVNKGSFLDN